MIDVSTILFVNFLHLDNIWRICILVPSVVLSNVTLVFLFSDWRTRLIPCLNRRTHRRFNSNRSRQSLKGLDFYESLYPATKDVFGSSKRVGRKSPGASVQQSASEEQDVRIESTLD